MHLLAGVLARRRQQKDHGSHKAQSMVRGQVVRLSALGSDACVDFMCDTCIPYNLEANRAQLLSIFHATDKHFVFTS